MLLRNLSACQYRKQGRTSWSFWQNPGATAKPPVNWRLGNLVRTPQNCYATVKLVALVAVPPGVVMAILPVSAPLGTIAVTRVSEFTVKVAFTPWKVTFVVCLRLTNASGGRATLMLKNVPPPVPPFSVSPYSMPLVCWTKVACGLQGAFSK